MRPQTWTAERKLTSHAQPAAGVPPVQGSCPLRADLVGQAAFDFVAPPPDLKASALAVRGGERPRVPLGLLTASSQK